MQSSSAREAIKELQREILTMYKLNHDNIVKLLAVTDGESQNDCHIIYALGMHFAFLLSFVSLTFLPVFFVFALCLLFRWLLVLCTHLDKAQILGKRTVAFHTKEALPFLALNN